MKYDDRNDYNAYYDDYDGYEDYDNYDEPQQYFLSSRDLTFFCLAFLTPAMMILTYGGAQTAARGTLAGSYIIATILTFLTLLSYRRLSRAFNDECSVVSFAGRGIHMKAGYFTGWASLGFYVIAACTFFIMGARAMAEMFSPVPYTFWLILIAAASAAIVLAGLRLTSTVIKVLVLGVIGISAIYILVCFIAAARGITVPNEPALPSEGGGFKALMSGAAVACLSFVGFDSVTMLSDESEDPKRGPGKGMAIALIIAAVIFFFQALASAAIAPNYLSLPIGTAIFDIGNLGGGAPMMTLLNLSIVLASLGIGIAAVNAAGRMLGILTESVTSGLVGRRRRATRAQEIGQTGISPVMALICTAAAIILALFIIPENNASIAFGLMRFSGMMCFMIVNFSALVYFRFKKRDPAYLRSVVIPGVGFLASLWVWVNVDTHSFDVGIIFVLAGIIILAISHIFGRLTGEISPPGENRAN